MVEPAAVEGPNPEVKPVGKFGDRLKREREMRGISLDEIAEATKIGKRSLRALEEDRFDQLPGGIFNKGFVRAYARCVGIDEEQAVADYLLSLGEQQKVADPVQMQQIAQQVQAQRTQMERNQNTVILWLAVLLVLAVGAVGWYGWHTYEKQKMEREVPLRQPKSEQQEAPQAQTQVPVATSPAAASTDANTNAPAGTPLTKESQPAISPVTTPQTTAPGNTSNANQTAQPGRMSAVEAAPDNAPINLTLKAVGRTWISVTVDGGKTETMTLDPDDSKMKLRSFHGKERVSLLMGNPAGIEATFNGKKLDQLGTEGQRKSVVFTPKGMQ